MSAFAPDRALRGAMVGKSADQTLANFSGQAIIPFDREVFDSDGFHDNAVNNGRLTIPAGFDRPFVQIGAALLTALIDPNVLLSLYVFKGGVNTYDGVAGQDMYNGTNTGPSMALCSGPLAVQPGDYFDLRLYCEDVSISVLQRTTFWLRAL